MQKCIYAYSRNNKSYKYHYNLTIVQQNEIRDLQRFEPLKTPMPRMANKDGRYHSIKISPLTFADLAMGPKAPLLVLQELQRKVNEKYIQIFARIAKTKKSIGRRNHLF